MIEKLRDNFDEMVVYKNLKKSNTFSALSLPSFMRDWLLKRFGDEDGQVDIEELTSFVRKFIPRKEDWIAIKDKIITERERVKFLAKISVDIDIRTGQVSFSLPDFGLANKDTVIEDSVWNCYKDDLVCGRETWGMVELGYRSGSSDNSGEGRGAGNRHGKIKLTAFKNFCPYIIDVEHYKDARNEFDIHEWIDVLLGAVDYNADGYEAVARKLNISTEEVKLTMLTRLLPFVEKRLNLIELAPKGTGKSYVFGRVSRFGWLSSGGVMSRAKMFYDLSKKTEGLISGHDFVVLDEVQTISFADVNEMRSVLKGYLESAGGVFTVGNYEGVADAGVILCGNIKKDTMDGDGFSNMFAELPEEFHESALIERFHGFIKGWNIPRMNEDLKVAGWALNSEYFCSILHELREDMSYRAIVDELIIVPDCADTRHTEAVKRIATAYLKLLFPNVRSAEDIDADVFERYCLRRAFQMREIIKYQVGILDVEYVNSLMPEFEVRSY